MAEQPVISVRGEAVREVAPELAAFSVTVSARDRDRHATLARLTERAAAQRALLDRYADAIERRETGAVQVYPEVKGRSERVSAYRGNVTTTVTVTDFAVLGDLLLRLGAEEQTAISGPWWRLRPGSRAGADVRREAIADALGRAREYADAVGARVDRLIEISDDGAGGGVQPMAAMAFRGAAADAAEMSLDLDPQQQTVHAAVVVRVAITEPSALG
jgi:uncharacterized protein YggE